eukprot:Rmarinus@m.5155
MEPHHGELLEKFDVLTLSPALGNLPVLPESPKLEVRAVAKSEVVQEVVNRPDLDTASWVREAVAEVCTLETVEQLVQEGEVYDLERRMEMLQGIVCECLGTEVPEYKRVCDYLVFLRVRGSELRRGRILCDGLCEGLNEPISSCVYIDAHSRYVLIKDGLYTPPSPMVWSRRLPRVVSRGALRRVVAFSGPVASVRISPDGSVLAVCAGCEVTLLNAVGEWLRLLAGHTARVWSCSFSPDGATLVSYSQDNTLRLWDIKTGVMVRLLRNVRSVYSAQVDFSDMGSKVVCASGNAVRVYSTLSGVELACLTRSTSGSSGQARAVGSVVLTVCFSWDGTAIAVGAGDRTVTMWEVATNECRHVCRGHTDRVRSVSWNRASTMLASGGNDKTIRVWDTATGACVRVFEGHTGWVSCISFSPDGSRIVSGSQDTTVRVWYISGAPSSCFHGHYLDVMSTRFHPTNSDWVFSTSEDGTLRMWDLALLALEETEGGDEEKEGCLGNNNIVEPGKKLDASAGAGAGVGVSARACRSSSVGARARVGAASVGSSLAKIRQEPMHEAVRCCAFSPDCSQLVSCSGDNWILLWDVASREIVQVLEGHSSSVNAVCFSPDGTQVASGSEDRTMRVWDLSTGGCHRYLKDTGCNEPILSVAFSPDGTCVATGTADQSICVWDVRYSHECVQVLRGHSSDVNCVSFNTAGSMMVSCSGDFSIRVWDTQTGQQFRYLRDPDGVCHFNSVCFTADGTGVVSGGTDKLVRVWDVETGAVCTWEAHTAAVTCVAVSSDGKMVASGSDDETVGIWNASTGRLLLRLYAHAKICTVCFAQDGQHVATGSHDKTLRIWDLSNFVARWDEVEATL